MEHWRSTEPNLRCDVVINSRFLWHRVCTTLSFHFQSSLSPSLAMYVHFGQCFRFHLSLCTLSPLSCTEFRAPWGQEPCLLPQSQTSTCFVPTSASPQALFWLSRRYSSQLFFWSEPLLFLPSTSIPELILLPGESCILVACHLSDMGHNMVR